MRIGWLDFSSEERAKINAILEQLKEKSNLDELGLAPIRDGFANLFFPGMSTLINRAKYFLIVPYALKDLEKCQGPNLAGRLQEIERDCAQKLVAGSTLPYIIGRRSLNHDSWVSQPPSEMYWGPLRHYGIFRKEDLSLAGCLRLLESCPPIKHSMRGRTGEEDGCEDDPDAGARPALGLWDPALPYSPNWRDNLQIILTREEAEYLKARFLAKNEHTMLGHILRHNLTQMAACENFLDFQNFIGLFPADIQADYWLARDFSLFTFVLRIAFALVISKDQNSEALNKWNEYAGRFSEIAGLALDRIFARLNLDLSVLENQNLKSFLEKAQAAMHGENMDYLKVIVARREQAIKQRPKSLSPEPILNWAGLYRLNYRFANCRELCEDIFAALGLLDGANV